MGLLHKLKRGWKSGGLFHPIKNWYLRKRFGAGCCDTYSLYAFLAPQIIAGLTEFRKSAVSYPMKYNSLEDWQKDLDEMIWSFEYWLRDEFEDDFKTSSKKERRAVKGNKLFGESFRSLWR